MRVGVSLDELKTIWHKVVWKLQTSATMRAQYQVRILFDTPPTMFEEKIMILVNFDPIGNEANLISNINLIYREEGTSSWASLVKVSFQVYVGQ